MFDVDQGLDEILGKYRNLLEGKTVGVVVYPEGSSGSLTRKINKLIETYTSFKTEIHMKNWKSNIDKSIKEIKDLHKLE